MLISWAFFCIEYFICFVNAIVSYLWFCNSGSLNILFCYLHSSIFLQASSFSLVSINIQELPRKLPSYAVLVGVLACVLYCGLMMGKTELSLRDTPHSPPHQVLVCRGFSSGTFLFLQRRIFQAIVLVSSWGKGERCQKLSVHFSVNSTIFSAYSILASWIGFQIQIFSCSVSLENKPSVA